MNVNLTDRGRGASLDRLERIFGRVLRGGVLAASALLALGLALWLFGAGAGVSSPLLHTGLIALMVTPVLRIVVSVAQFAIARDWFFVLVAAAVLAVLGGTLWAAMSQF